MVAVDLSKPNHLLGTWDFMDILEGSKVCVCPYAKVEGGVHWRKNMVVTSNMSVVVIIWPTAKDDGACGVHEKKWTVVMWQGIMIRIYC